MAVPREGDPLCPTGAVVLRGRRGVLARKSKRSTWRKGECTWCGHPVTESRRSLWCSQRCVDAYAMTQPAGQLAALQARDGGRCSLCGLDTERLRLACTRWLAVFGADRTVPPRSMRHWPYRVLYPQRAGALADLAHLLTLRGYPTGDRAIRHLMGERRCWWDGDHTIPIVDGGHPCDLRNLRTLCWWCHKRETSEAATRRAEARRMTTAPAPEPTAQIAMFDAPDARGTVGA